MTKKMSFLLISFFGLFVTFFIIWFFFLSIYEVRFVYDFNPKDLIINSEYRIKCEGVNLLGGKIDWRDLGFTFDVKDGKDIISYHFNSPNQYSFKITGKGNGVIELNSKFALNPTIISVRAMDQ